MTAAGFTAPPGGVALLRVVRLGSTTSGDMLSPQRSPPSNGSVRVPEWPAKRERPTVADPAATAILAGRTSAQLLSGAPMPQRCLATISTWRSGSGRKAAACALIELAAGSPLRGGANLQPSGSQPPAFSLDSCSESAPRPRLRVKLRVTRKLTGGTQAGWGQIGLPLPY